MLQITVLGLAVCSQIALPGVYLPVQRAQEEAYHIVVAEVGKTSDRLNSSILMWTELKPSVVLKGKVSGEELNTHPLSVRAEPVERLPKTGEELIVFLGHESDGYPIIKMMPKTEANLKDVKAAIRNDRSGTGQGTLGLSSRSGGGIGGGTVGGGIGGGLGRAERPRFVPAPHPSYQGTKIYPEPKATGESLKVQKEFAAVMARDNPKAQGREAHFAWLEKNEYVRRFDVRQIGWTGSVLDCTPRPEGGWVVKVTIHPWLSSRRLRHTLMGDSVQETWEFVGGQVRLLETNAATIRPDRQIFPVAL